LKKARLFIWGDAVAPTGFARVLHSIIKHFPKNAYDITWLGVNYRGDPHEYDLKIYPASFNKNDPLGYSRLPEVLRLANPDVILLLGDIWQLDNHIDAIKKEYDSGHIPPTFCYFPVDAEDHAAEWYKNMHLVYPITYTEFGRKVALKARPDVTFFTIPHGVDTDKFYKIEDREAVLKGAFPKDTESFRDNFIVLNANRNQPRKRLDVTMRGFAMFAKDKPENVRLYMHSGIVDSSIDIPDLARRYGIDKRLIISSTTPGIQQVSDKKLNFIYNACNVGINTSLGEGWGLCLHEDTPIWTLDGIKKIKDVSVGDYTITHLGRPRKIIGKFDNGEKDLVKVSTENGRVLYSTKEHEVLTLQGFKKVGDLSKDDFIAHSLPKLSLVDYQLDLADNLDYFCDDIYVWEKNALPVITNKRKRFLSLNNDIPMLIGSYLSRGKIVRGKCTITMRTDEDARKLQGELMALNVESSLEYFTKYKKAQVVITDKVIIEMLSRYFGTTMRRKKVPTAMFGYDLSEVVKYYIRNRYTISPFNVDRKKIRFRAFTQSLASFLAHQLYAKGITIGIRYLENAHGPFFEFNVFSRFRHDILPSRFEYEGASRVYAQEDGRYFIKVASVEIDPNLSRGHVYDLEVEEDHSYTANGLIVHNCSVEHAATGAIQLVPDSSACRELFHGCGILMNADTDYVQDKINTTGKLVRDADVASALQYVYDHPEESEKIAERARKKFTSEEFGWKSISEAWHLVFQEAINGNNMARKHAGDNKSNS